MQVGEMIRELLDIHGMSVPQLAEKAGLCLSTVHSVMNEGSNPELTTALEICQVFNIPVTYFFKQEMHPTVLKAMAIFFSATPEQRNEITDLIMQPPQFGTVKL